jgi:hypothetical protein
MGNEKSRSTSDRTRRIDAESARETERIDFGQDSSVADASAALRSKLSVNVSHDISERLRSLAYAHRLSESSIVEVALTMFFTRGDDAMLGVLLKELGATLRRR